MELAKYNIDIAALCETRFSESGSLNDLECSFFRSGKPEGERREAGVSFAIKKDIVTKPTEMPRPQKDERKPTWRHPRSGHWYMIDVIITRCRDKMDINSTRSMRGANCWTYHQMLTSKVAFGIRQKHIRQRDKNDTKGFYNGLTEVWGPKKKGPIHMKSTNGMETFSDSKRVVGKRNDHFQRLLTVPGNIPQRITKTSLDEIPTMAEMARAIAGLKDGKTTVGDGIPADVWKHGGDNLFSRLHQQITNAWELQEKCIEQDRPLHMVFIVFSKAFDTVGRTGIWQLLRKYGCPEKFTTMIEALHTGLMANVNVGGEVSESFSVTNGAKQGCVLAATLFSIFLSSMLSEALRDIVMASTYRSDKSADLFNVANFRAKTKTTRILMRELPFADDSALVAHSAEEMQNIVDAFSDASKTFGLKINIKKTEVLYQPNSTRTREEDNMFDGNKLNSVLEFTYHGSTISSDGYTDDEIQRRMAKASASFGRLRTGTDRAAIYGRSPDQKQSPMDWTPHEDVTRQATKADSRISTVFWSQKERVPSSPVQGYHQEKREAERHKDRLMDTTLTADR
ncbi:hypothetical protein NP493_1493g00012 [Ridgeia piscesae]|uniref:Reverse transcriptase domain-containing protein n=1 Tax=Ridgeia piscesae TaxID=27915 RepID=A0AAD9K128_RIDPI|nr:hypothetical protein NP493_1493g00012 [Ridgeia piscesae]